MLDGVLLRHVPAAFWRAPFNLPAPSLHPLFADPPPPPHILLPNTYLCTKTITTLSLETISATGFALKHQGDGVDFTPCPALTHYRFRQLCHFKVRFHFCFFPCLPLALMWVMIRMSPRVCHIVSRGNSRVVTSPFLTRSSRRPLPSPSTSATDSYIIKCLVPLLRCLRTSQRRKS